MKLNGTLLAAAGITLLIAGTARADSVIGISSLTSGTVVSYDYHPIIIPPFPTTPEEFVKVDNAFFDFLIPVGDDWDFITARKFTVMGFELPSNPFVLGQFTVEPAADYASVTSTAVEEGMGHFLISEATLVNPTPEPPTLVALASGLMAALLASALRGLYLAKCLYFKSLLLLPHILR